MATINVSLNYPRYQSRTSTGGVSCQKWQFLYFYGHHQKQFLCTFWWRNHGLGRNNSTWQDLVIVDGNLNSRRYIDEILRPVVVPYVQNMGQGALFQDDNARPHRARIVDAYLQEQITRVDWPACSPDLNPIEHAWNQLGRAVQTRLNVDSTRADLRRLLLEEWDRLPCTEQYSASDPQHAPQMCRMYCCRWWSHPLLMYCGNKINV